MKYEDIITEILNDIWAVMAHDIGVRDIILKIIIDKNK